MHHHYQNFSAHDFLTDARFRAWVLSPDTDSDKFWQTYRTLYPKQERELDKARQILLQLHEERKVAPQRIVDEDWEKLNGRLFEETESPKSRQVQWRPWLVAASVSLLFALGYLLWAGLPFSSNHVYTTAYGETQRLVLPDSSIVILNANSTLEYADDWDKTAAREVWLNGEAYFEVEEKETITESGTNLVKFLVHTPELQVQVVGTAFSVNTRQERTQVTLNHGKVIVRDKQDETIAMEPGEQVELSHQQQKLVKKTVIPENYNSWKDNKLEFVNMPVAEIIQMLEERYGWQFEIEAPGFLENRYKGSAPAEEPEVLLEKWRLVYGLEIDKNKETIIISK